MFILPLAFRLPVEARQQLDRIEQKLDRLLAQEKTNMINLTALLAAVEQETSVEKSALALIQHMSVQQADLAKQLADAIAANDPAKLAEVQAAIDASVKTLAENDAELAAAVTANTPATPPQAGASV